MALLGGKGGVGHILAAVAAALLLRLFSGPGPALSPEDESDGGSDGEFENGEDKSPGNVSPVTIKWSNITCSLSDKSSQAVRFLLKGVSGEAKPRRLLAIMGPSGSGKTTLLNVLAGQIVASTRLHLSGLLEVNGRPIATRSYKLAYVRQEDLFFSQLTVRETLSLAAELQLQELSSVEERDEYVNYLLFKLGLVSCADSRVGDAKVRGISGGEKKRLSLACELMASPSVIFADEPTTGLDAFQAEKVMETLRQLAQDGHTVICSIHQPRGSVYGKFDDIVLLTEGALVYAGPAREEPLEYFSKFGYHCPAHVNPAEFLADLISIDYSSSQSVYSSQKRIDGLVESFSQQTSAVLYATPLVRRETSKNSMNFRTETTVRKKGGWWRQFWLLLKRAWMQASRDGPTNKVRARMSIASAIIFGSVFWRMGRSQTSIQDRMGLLQVAAINTAMAALTKTGGVFPKERAIVDRERAKGSYGLGPYLLSKLLAEIPIGAAFPLLFGTILYPMARLHPNFSSPCGVLISAIVFVAFHKCAVGKEQDEFYPPATSNPKPATSSPESVPTTTVQGPTTTGDPSPPLADVTPAYLASGDLPSALPSLRRPPLRLTQPPATLPLPYPASGDPPSALPSLTQPPATLAARRPASGDPRRPSPVSGDLSSTL
ncbi:hypothetical protein RHGRI_026215 [Rhododendron griersonianum]|uniref:ABC transporter domain-containing protein n=1 Tax=Rhododendron griersonianum TaxID=479676 RepID=A0AAV6ITC9_9ERIC|nr:hypothetical protein RHGRI_026215 [Rhododendron griersonianum]KAG5531528.1 hypothetical protein RHGRI_026215 [Rhododendron griersonianum]